jgi:hypothetical protein
VRGLICFYTVNINHIWPFVQVFRAGSTTKNQVSSESSETTRAADTKSRGPGDRSKFWGFTNVRCAEPSGM